MTGAPGVGKTTLIERISQHYRAKGLRIAGMTTREVREGNRRVGFRINDLSSGAEGWLAKIREGQGPRIGRYTVVSEDLENVGVKALVKSTHQTGDMTLVDEIGPMEMTNDNFRKAIADILSQDRIVISTIRQGAHYPEVELATRNSDVARIELSNANRDEAFVTITSILDRWVGSRS